MASIVRVIRVVASIEVRGVADSLLGRHADHPEDERSAIARLAL
jgi:hypothetical protein